MEETRKCIHCREIKNIEEFVPRKKNHKSNVCKSCTNNKASIYRLKKKLQYENNEIAIPKTKICFDCNIEYPIDDFYRHATTVDCRRIRCKKCHSINTSNVGKIRARNNGKKFWCQSTISAHGVNGIKINFIASELYKKIEDIHNCEICGNLLNFERCTETSNKKPLDQKPSLDRKLNNKIVNLDEIMILCSKCNMTKQNRSLDEFVEYCQFIVTKFKKENQ